MTEAQICLTVSPVRPKMENPHRGPASCPTTCPTGMRKRKSLALSSSLPSISFLPPPCPPIHIVSALALYSSGAGAWLLLQSVSCPMQRGSRRAVAQTTQPPTPGSKVASKGASGALHPIAALARGDESSCILSWWRGSGHRHGFSPLVVKTY